MAATTRNAIVQWIGRRTVKVTWSLLDGDDVGDVQDFSRFSQVQFQVLGTFDSGTLIIEGTHNGGTTFATLNDTRGEGNALSFTAADLRKANEVVPCRPSVSGGGGSTSLTVIAIASATP